MWDWTRRDWKYGRVDWNGRGLEDWLGWLDCGVKDGGKLAEGVDMVEVKTSEWGESGWVLEGSNEVSGGGACGVDRACW